MYPMGEKKRGQTTKESLTDVIRYLSVQIGNYTSGIEHARKLLARCDTDRSVCMWYDDSTGRHGRFDRRKSAGWPGKGTSSGQIWKESRDTKDVKLGKEEVV